MSTDTTSPTTSAPARKGTGIAPPKLPSHFKQGTVADLKCPAIPAKGYVVTTCADNKIARDQAIRDGYVIPLRGMPSGLDESQPLITNEHLFGAKVGDELKLDNGDLIKVRLKSYDDEENSATVGRLKDIFAGCVLSPVNTQPTRPAQKHIAGDLPDDDDDD